MSARPSVAEPIRAGVSSLLSVVNGGAKAVMGILPYRGVPSAISLPDAPRVVELALKFYF